jgi:hypothetical protein
MDLAPFFHETGLIIPTSFLLPLLATNSNCKMTPQDAAVSDLEATIPWGVVLLSWFLFCREIIQCQKYGEVFASFPSI